MKWRRCHARIARNQRCLEPLGEGDVGSIVSSEISAQRPDAGEQGLVRVPLDRQPGQQIEGKSTSLRGDFPAHLISPQSLGDLDVQKRGGVQALVLVEKP